MSQAPIPNEGEITVPYTSNVHGIAIGEVLVGPPGPPGPEGPAGAQGFPGPAGPTGADGSSGSPGATGADGPPGAEGPPGSAGPQGVAGPAGPAGLNWRGPWSNTTTYVANDAVGYTGASWFALRSTTGAVPDTSPIDWALLAAQGSPGPAGPQGSPGSQGPPGADGPAGAPGSAGPSGPAGADSTVPGPAGDAGPEGPPGPTGADSTVAGPPGAKGDKGDKGDPGSAGSAGPAGAGVGFGIIPVTGMGAWHGIPIVGGPSGTAAVTKDFIWAVPLVVPYDIPITAIGVDVTTSASGGLMRVGIYRHAITGPTTLWNTLGSISTAATGLQTAVVSGMTLPTGYYWLACVPYNSASSPTVRAFAGGGVLSYLGTAGGINAGGITGIFSNSTVSGGTLPASFPAWTNNGGGGMPYVKFKVD